MKCPFPMGASIADGGLLAGGSAKIPVFDPKAASALSAAAKRQADISKAASLIAGSQPVYGGQYYAPESGLPSWLLPVGLGIGAVALVLLLKK